MPRKPPDEKRTKFILSKANTSKRIRVQPKDNVRFATDGKVIICLNKSQTVLS